MTDLIPGRLYINCFRYSLGLYEDKDCYITQESYIPPQGPFLVIGVSSMKNYKLIVEVLTDHHGYIWMYDEEVPELLLVDRR